MLRLKSIKSSPVHPFGLSTVSVQNARFPIQLIPQFVRLATRPVVGLLTLSSVGQLVAMRKCFYCAAPLSLVAGSSNTDVDHFFPHALKQRRLCINFDGVWNLVLSCAVCNRGKHGKFDRIPSAKLLDRLFGRNEYFIGSHHPLRETLINQTGASVTVRRAFLADVYQKVQLNPAQAWAPSDEND